MPEQSANGGIFLFPDGRMDAKSAARYLGLAPKTLATYRSQGIGPRFVKRGRVFYFQAELDAWIRAGSATTSDRRPASAAAPPAERPLA